MRELLHYKVSMKRGAYFVLETGDVLEVDNAESFNRLAASALRISCMYLQVTVDWDFFLFFDDNIQTSK